jgi:TolB-like protein/DNA-binding winged helix-turn-helix (wHTH) protein
VDGPGSSLFLNGRVVDFGRETVLDATGAPVSLRPQCFDVLRYLAHNAGRVVTKDELMAAVWPDIAVTDDSLVQCIHEIRRAICDERHAVLRTVPRRGYLFEPALETPASAGRIRLRGIGLAAALLLAAAGAVAVWMAPAPEAPPRNDVWVAVLPFAVVGGDEQQAAFAEAFSDDVVTELMRSRLLRVLARASVAAYAGPPADLSGLAERLGADYALGGQFDALTEEVRLTAWLIDTRTRINVWSDRFDQPASTLIVRRDDLVTDVVGRVASYSGVIWRDKLEQAEREQPRRLSALDHLVKAKWPIVESMDESSVREARLLTQKALEIDPDLALAHARLAETYLHEVFAEWGDPAVAWAAFEAAVARGIQADPQYGRLLHQRALIAFSRGEVEAGRAAWERGLASYPRDALLIGGVGMFTAIALGVEEAEAGLVLVERAAAIDPLNPLLHGYRRGYALYFAERYPEAVSELRKVLRPWFDIRVMRAIALAQSGDVDGALVETGEILRLDPDFSAENWIARGFYQPGGSSARRFVEGARRAGLPICAGDAAAIPVRKRLPECAAGRAADEAAIAEAVSSR